MSSSERTGRFLIARHVETEKNRRSIHGSSSLDSISTIGRKQAAEVAQICRNLRWVSGIVYAPTRQAIATAQLVSEIAQLPMTGPLGLSPVNLGVAAGKSQAELYREMPQVAYSLDMFRHRAIPASELAVPGAESMQSISRRISEWQETHGFTSLVGSLVIVSSSILTMLTNLVAGDLPGPDYYNYVASSGSLRAFELMAKGPVQPAVPLSLSSWPESESHEIATQWGRIKATRFLPSWEVRQAAAIIIPGYFSNARAGPYGLFTRLAQRLALEGIATYTYDPLGYGESDPVRRSLESDMLSLRAVVSRADSAHLILLGHSMTAAFVSLTKSELGSSAATITRIALAPMTGLETILANTMPLEESDVIRNHKTLVRHGMPIDEQYIVQADQLWQQGYAAINMAVFGASDHYVQPAWVCLSDRTLVKEIARADHNFSHTEAAFDVISLIVGYLREVTSSTESRLGIGGRQ